MADSSDPSTSSTTRPKIQGPSPKMLRSVSGLGVSKSPVLSPICIICKKKDRYIKVRGKRERDRLSCAETLDGGSLRKTAERKKDESILMHIRDKDCAAIGVRYHHSCYKEYTRPVKQDTPEAANVERHPYTKSYQHFCKEVVQKRIIEGQAVLRMTQLLQYFKNYVMKFESVDASDYRSSQLKARLMTNFPQLTFHTLSSKSSSTLVYLGPLEAGNVEERLESLFEGMTSSETDAAFTERRHPQHLNGENLKTVYYAGLEVKWTTQDPAPESVFLSVSCKCSASKCASKSCSCRAYKLSCTDVCGCNYCTNKSGRKRAVTGSEDEDDID
ncbi:uncharacterized protein LOC106180450 isoform X1 [Lingula anatina]|uniref:Uncharacterized protein LOC106180450 isoform X1 n=2 Tax=Lingula anatina TaxID=7574 RepID=A0A1S3KBL8_LINAN|nr:uncharacterized protein LOC106180450 isoform X1 [Lingula anatina]|eukprot:XP_013419887.1 uncharacterized protein LOC106180450 isoform X1 [Lingula anatina]